MAKNAWFAYEVWVNRRSAGKYDTTTTSPTVHVIITTATYSLPSLYSLLPLPLPLQLSTTTTTNYQVTLQTHFEDLSKLKEYAMPDKLTHVGGREPEENYYKALKAKAKAYAEKYDTTNNTAVDVTCKTVNVSGNNNAKNTAKVGPEAIEQKN